MSKWKIVLFLKRMWMKIHRKKKESCEYVPEEHLGI
jgi:hypothetical protein